jgi:hypothetical protein
MSAYNESRIFGIQFGSEHGDGKALSMQKVRRQRRMIGSLLSQLTSCRQ